MSFNLSSFKETCGLFLPHLKKRENSTAIVFTLLIIAIDIAVANILPFYSKYIVDTLLPQYFNIIGERAIQTIDYFKWLLFPVLFLGFLITCEKILNHLQDIIFFPVINRCIRDTNQYFIQHLHAIPYLSYQALNIQEVINAMRRVSQSARAFIKILCLMIIPSAIKLIIFCYMMAKWGFYGYGLIFTIICALWVLYKGTQWYIQARNEAWNCSDNVMIRVNDSLLNTKLTRFFKTREKQDIRTLLDLEASLWHKTNTRLHSIHVFIGIILGIGITGILFSALQSVFNLKVTVGDFIKLQGQLIAAFIPLKTVSVELRMLAESLIDINKIHRLLNIKPTGIQAHFESLPFAEHNTFVDNTKPSIGLANNMILKLSNVSFYREGNAILKNIDLTIHSGDKILIKGNSGSGKSTLLQLITGLYAPTKGKISGPLVYNTSLMCYIPQDIFLFNDSIRYNLCYGLSNFSDQILLSVLEKVNLKDKILSLPKHLDSPVGDLGQFLSDGEIQRLALTRALLAKPACLILDETTHAIDNETETMIMQYLCKVIPTIIMVSHRVSAHYYANKTFILHNGKLSEETPEQQKLIKESAAILELA